MLARKVGSAWEIETPAKLNLYLEVLGRRTDGFHEVETLMAPVRIFDWLRWAPQPDVEPTIAEPSIALEYHPATPADYQEAAPADETNLVCRAAAALGRAAGMAPYGRLTLLKRIPPQAGLGGGSSDAAAALVLLNVAWGLAYPPRRLAEVAAELGSDVPFFLAGKSAVCRGRGEQIEPLPAVPRLDVVVVKPPAGLDTAAVYRSLQSVLVSGLHGGESAGRLAGLLAALREGAWARAARGMTNRLQQAAEGLCPWIAKVEAAFGRLSCLAHQMTGSGSAYFGVMRSARHARRAAGMLSSWNLGTVFATATCR